MAGGGKEFLQAANYRRGGNIGTTPISLSASPPLGGRWRPGDDVLLLADHFIRTLGAQMGKGDLKLSRTCGSAAAVFSPRPSPGEPPPLT